MNKKYGRYEVIKPLGGGGMAQVYLAKDPRLRRQVAIKVITALLDDQQMRERFEHEAVAMAQLSSHQSIVPIYDFGDDADGHPYLVMPFMRGGSLADRLKQGTFSLGEAAQLLERLALAIDFAHSLGMVHRDLKPLNILLDKQGAAYIADFGLVKLLNVSIPWTKTGKIMGSPPYMSPEQGRGLSVDERTDIYALGVIAFEMLTGKWPYESDNAMGFIFQHSFNPIPDICAVNTSLPAALQPIIERVLAKEPQDRYATAGEFATAIKGLLGHRQQASVPQTVPVISLPTAQEYLARGNQYYSQKEYEKAIAQYSQAILLEPQNAYAYLNRGLAHYVLAQPDKAISDYNQAAHLNRQSATTFYYRGLAYQYKGQLEQAIRDYDEALRINRQFSDAANKRQAAYDALLKGAQTAYQKGQLDKALADYDAALRLNPHDKGLQKLRQQVHDAKHPPLGIGSERVCAKDGMVQVYVPAGKFLMGSRNDDPDAYDWEKPQHEVYLDGYWIDKTPITNAMFAKFVQETGYDAGSKWQSKAGKGRENHPVVYVFWNDAVAYAKWADRRLPTEAEWEKAAGGTDARKWPWGNNPPTNKLCNFGRNVGDTTPVGNYPAGASPYGALDMAGNVWEWCHDSFDANYYASSPKANPQGSKPQETKVLRGGSWDSTVRSTRARNRSMSNIATYPVRVGYWGFRCAR